MSNPFIKRMMKDERAEIFHSSAYGRAQSGGTIGAASTESFETRQEIEKSRQTIRRYDDSMVAGQRFNKEAQGSTRLDQPTEQSEAKPAFYEEMLNAAKTNSGMKVDAETSRASAAAATANSTKDAAVARAERTARQLMGQGKITEKEMEQQIARAQARAAKSSGVGVTTGETADLNSMAQQRAERSARFADRRAMGAGGAGASRPQPVAPMRQMPRISSRPPRAF